MGRRLETFIDLMQQATTLEELQTLILDLRDLYDVEHLVYHSVNAKGDQYAVLTYEDPWVDHYIAQHYERIDPVVIGCFQSLGPVDWKELDWSSKSARRFLAEAVDSRVGNQGLSVPIRGPGGQFALFTINDRGSDDSWARYSDEFRRDLILIGHYVNTRAQEIEQGAALNPVQPLSPREIDALTLLAMGYSRAHAADSLKISEHTLRVYIEGARHKLGSANTTHAVASALSRGLILI